MRRVAYRTCEFHAIAAQEFTALKVLMKKELWQVIN
jgi:hypothetical protein